MFQVSTASHALVQTSSGAAFIQSYLRSLAPSPQGLTNEAVRLSVVQTNDDKVGAKSADGVSGSRVRVKSPLDRRANKFDRWFQSVDDDKADRWFPLVKVDT